MGLLGSIQMAEGGLVKGGVPGRDSVPAWLTPGEVVLPVAMVAALERLSRGGGAPTQAYATGGRVEPRHERGGDTVVIRADAMSVTDIDRMMRDRYLKSQRRLQRRGVRV